MGSPESVAAYQKLVNEWLENGKRLPADSGSMIKTTGGQAVAPVPAEITIVELCDKYETWAKAEYGDGPRTEYGNILDVIAPMVRLLGRLPVSDFGPNALREVHQTMIDGTHREVEAGEPKPERLSRTTINRRIHRIRRIFSWAIGHEHVKPKSDAVNTIKSLFEVEALREGKGVKEARPVRAVSEKTVEATIPHLPKPIDDMVRLQSITGMRSGEFCIIRACDIDMSGKTWLYRPSRHKNTHRDQGRIVWLGPQCQEIIQTQKRPGWRKLMEEFEARRVDRVVCWRVDRLGRRATGLNHFFDQCFEFGANLISLRDGIDLSTPAGRMVAGVLASIAQFECESMKERQWAKIDVDRARSIEAHEMREGGASLDAIGRKLAASVEKVERILAKPKGTLWYGGRKNGDGRKAECSNDRVHLLAQQGAEDRRGRGGDGRIEADSVSSVEGESGRGCSHGLHAGAGLIHLRMLPLNSYGLRTARLRSALKYWPEHQILVFVCFMVRPSVS